MDIKGYREALDKIKASDRLKSNIQETALWQEKCEKSRKEKNKGRIIDGVIGVVSLVGIVIILSVIIAQNSGDGNKKNANGNDVTNVNNGENENNNLDKNEDGKGEDIDEIKVVHMYDITGDSKEEEIVVHVWGGECNGENAVEIYSGETGKMIWSKHLCEEHCGSIGIVQRQEKNRIYIWNEDFEKKEYCLQVLEITEEGNCSVLEKYESDFVQGKNDEEEIKKILKYHNDVVFMTKDGMSLISYNPEVCYSTQESVKGDVFSEEGLIGDIVLNMYEKTENIIHYEECSRGDNYKAGSLKINDEIEWSYDVTGDSVKEKIVVKILDPYAAEKQNTVEIYSGKNGKLIWKTFITNSHMNRGSVGIIKKNGRDYIYEWNPDISQGYVAYLLKILDINDEGESEVIEEHKLNFDIELAGEEEIEKMLKYQTEINEMFRDSVCLISYVWEELYSMPDSIKKDECCSNEVTDVVGSIVVGMDYREKNND